MQHGLERDRGIFCQRVAQCQRPVRRQLDDEAVRKRTRGILVIILGISGTPCNRDRGQLHTAGTIRPSAVAGRRIVALLDGRIFLPRFILGANITPVHRQAPFGINADEDAGAGDVGGIIDD
ncbi:MAG: hypothetical protein E6973_07730 [Enterobacter hormaechei]|nr:hypothetical protein [Enterobacter hormaechei]